MSTKIEKIECNELWEGLEFEIQESDSGVSTLPDGVLARVKGPAFFPDKTSRNNLHYTREMWDKVLESPDLQQRLKDRTIFGTIGHDTPLTDKEIRSGLFSHVITEMWIDESNIGQITYEILDTEPGRILNMLLRTNSKISVSTKAKALIKTVNGLRTIRTGKYVFERIDAVLTPGFVEALPEISESLNNILTQNRSNNMSDESSKLVTVLESRIEALEKENTEITDEAKQLNKSVGSFEESAREAEKSLEAVVEELEKFREIGTVEHITEALDISEETITTLETQLIESRESLESVPESVAKLELKLEAFEALGTLEQLSEVLDTCEAYTEQPTNEEFEAYSELGTSEDFSKAITALEAYSELGTPEQLLQVVERLEEALEAKDKAELIKMAKESGMSDDKLKSLGDKGFSTDQIKDVIASCYGDDDDDDDKDTVIEKKKKTVKKSDESFSSRVRAVKSVDESAGSTQSKAVSRCSKLLK